MAARLVATLSAQGVPASETNASLALARARWQPAAAAKALAEEAAAAAEATSEGGGAAAPGSVCGICFEPPAPPAELLSLRCGHEFCSDCWGGLMTTALQSGAGCIHTRCPQPDCPVLLPAELWQRCLPAGTAAGAWSMLHLRSFVDANALLCWCPSASCSTN